MTRSHINQIRGNPAIASPHLIASIEMYVPLLLPSMAPRHAALFRKWFRFQRSILTTNYICEFFSGTMNLSWWLNGEKFHVGVASHPDWLAKSWILSSLELRRARRHLLCYFHYGFVLDFAGNCLFISNYESCHLFNGSAILHTDLRLSRTFK